jgi:hypothetical protein
MRGNDTTLERQEDKNCLPRPASGREALSSIFVNFGIKTMLGVFLGTNKQSKRGDLITVPAVVSDVTRGPPAALSIGEACVVNWDQTTCEARELTQGSVAVGNKRER